MTAWCILNVGSDTRCCRLWSLATSANEVALSAVSNGKYPDCPVGPIAIASLGASHGPILSVAAKDGSAERGQDIYGVAVAWQSGIHLAA